MKVYLSPSDQVGNLYSYGNTNEATQCRKIAAACKTALERCGFAVKINTKDGSNAMYDRVKESNAWGADLHVCIHTNAGGGSGCVVFVDELDEKHKKYAQPVYDAVSAITRANEKYGIRTANFYEIRKTTGLCVYVECEFHDNVTDAKWIVENITAIGEALCRGICKGCGVTYKEPKSVECTKQEKNEMRYKTINDVPEWAQAEIKELIELGCLNGTGDGNLDVSDDMLRSILISYRASKALMK